MKIGIGLTTHNRSEVAQQTYAALEKFQPPNSIIAVVDDASHDPAFGYANNYMPYYVRFENHVGVGVAKNKCLELLHDAGCTHFFLFDDDCFPVVHNWWEPYIDSKLKHACWTFDRKVIFAGDYYTEYEKPNGCMLYFTRAVIDKVGGWDLEFQGYGYDHCNLSDRIYNAGLTPGRYVSVPYTKPLFQLANCPSSFTSEDREQIPHNLKLYQQKYYSKEFKPFK